MAVVTNPLTVLLYDSSGVAMFVSNGVTTPAGTSGIIVAGSDGTTTRFLRTATDGTVRVDPTGTTTQPISAASLPLPTGAATSAIQTGGTQKTQVVDAAGNVQPSQDVVGRAAFVKLTDGTNTAPTFDAAARAGFFKITDGVNLMPTGDALARSIFVRLSDGTNGPAAIKAASTAPVATDKAAVVVVSPNQQAIPVTLPIDLGSPVLSYGEITTAAATQVKVNKTTYTEQTTNAQRSISSASASDTNTAGTGARQVKITYLDASGNGPFTETVNLNGTTAVNTVSTTICFIEKLEVVSVGSGGSNAGIITLFAATAGGGGAIGTITAGDNRTFWGHNYVPVGKTGYVTGLSGHNNSTTAISLFTLKAITLPVGTNAELQISHVYSHSGVVAQGQLSYNPPLVVTGPARIALYVTPSVATSVISRGGFNYYEK